MSKFKLCEEKCQQIMEKLSNLEILTSIELFSYENDVFIY